MIDRTVEDTEVVTRWIGRRVMVDHRWADSGKDVSFFNLTFHPVAMYPVY